MTSMTAATTAVAVRLLRKYVRSPQLLVWSVAGGAIFIVLFRYIFGGSIRFGSLPYVDFLMPGMILTSVLVNGAGTAIGVAEDREQGFFDRLRSLPMPRSALLAGRVHAQEEDCRLTLGANETVSALTSAGMRFSARGEPQPVTGSQPCVAS